MRVISENYETKLKFKEIFNGCRDINCIFFAPAIFKQIENYTSQFKLW